MSLGLVYFIGFIFHVLSFYSGTANGSVQRCSTNDPDGMVINLSDGTNDRCVAAIVPESNKPLPILFWFHGGGGSAEHCGEEHDGHPMRLIDYAKQYGFALVCGEALQTEELRESGQWKIPQIQTDETGPVCSDDDSIDAMYMKNVVETLDEQPEVFDTSKLFTFGCSMGSGFSEWIAVCMHSWYEQGRVPAFATHSTGLKIKGDGNHFPPGPYDGEEWGECESCQYFPTVPILTGQKACLADNDHDPNEFDPMFYR